MDGIAFVTSWLDDEAARDARSVWLVGFSGGAVMAGALLVSAPHRFTGVAMLHGTLPFDTGLPVVPNRLASSHVFYGYGESDTVVPRELIDRSCTYLRDASGAHATIRGYRAGHEVSPSEQRDLARWYSALT